MKIHWDFYDNRIFLSMNWNQNSKSDGAKIKLFWEQRKNRLKNQGEKVESKWEENENFLKMDKKLFGRLLVARLCLFDSIKCTNQSFIRDENDFFLVGLGLTKEFEPSQFRAPDENTVIDW